MLNMAPFVKECADFIAVVHTVDSIVFAIDNAVSVFNFSFLTHLQICCDVISMICSCEPVDQNANGKQRRSHLDESGYLKMNKITIQNVIVDNANDRIKLPPVNARRIKC